MTCGSHKAGDIPCRYSVYAMYYLPSHRAKAKFYCLVTEAHVWENLARSRYLACSRTCTFKPSMGFTRVRW